MNEKTALEELQKFKTYLEQAKRVLISTHLLPDGDGLGAEIALYHYLKRAKKSCRIYNPDLLPKRYQFLDKKEQILLGPGQVEIWDTFDLWIIVDTNDPRRVGKLWNDLLLRAKKIVFLDHHVNVNAGTSKDHSKEPKAESPPPAEVHYPPHASVVSDPQSSSIGELLYRIFNQLSLTKICPEIALGLYVSVMTDTNSFRYARTTPLAHQIAGEMIKLGINPEEVYQNIYSSKEISHLKLLGVMLQNVKVTPDGKVAWIEMSSSTRNVHRASSDDTQSFLNLLLLLKDAEIVCFFREEDQGHVRVSMKSKGKVVLSDLANKLGGGGHEFAAGFVSPWPLAATISKVIPELQGLFNKALF